MVNKKIKPNLFVDVHLLLVKKNKILLLLRKNTGYEDGKYHLPAGHKEEKESPIQALIRETKEEVGIHLYPQNIKFVHIMYNFTDSERVAFFFVVKKWRGKIKNMEPKKHEKISWFPLNNLPKNIVPYAEFAIKCYQKRIFFSEFRKPPV